MSDGTSRKRKHQMKKKESLEVLCRLSPCCDEDAAIRLYNENTVRTCPPSGLLQRSGSPYPEILYKFGYVFDDCESQQDVFERSTLDMVDQLVRGKNGLLFTYGVTGSGKTYTMTGQENSINCGILPRTIDVLFKSLPCQMDRCVFVPDGRNGFEIQSERAAANSRDESQEVPTRRKFRVSGTKKVKGFNEQMVSSVFVSYVEIYNNLCYDLFDESLTDDRTNMSRELRVNGTNVYVDHLTEVEVETAEQVLELYDRAQERRKVADTLLNKTSSRSHSIFNIRVVMAPCRVDSYYPVGDASQIVVGQLSLVDLAGSERTKRTANSGERLVEAGKINQSLMVLRQCFEKLRERDRTHVKTPIPYRESKITLLFKNFFEGSGKIRMIICVNPRAGDFEENLNVLNFGELSQDIRTMDGPDPVMPKLMDSTNTQFSRREILFWRKRFNEEVVKPISQVDFNVLRPLPRINLTDPENMAIQIEERRKAITKNLTERRQYTDLAVQKQNSFRENFVNLLCQLDLTNNRLKFAVSESEEVRSENERLQKLLNQTQRENSAYKLRIARNEVEEDYKLRQEERDRQRTAEVEEECRAKDRKIEMMRELFETKPPVGNDGITGGSVAKLSRKFNEGQAVSGRPPKAPRQGRAESAPRVPKTVRIADNHGLEGPHVGGIGYVNTKHGGRRSQSANGRILAHQPNHQIPSGTVMRAKLPKGALRTTKPEAADLNKSREYILTHQEIDVNGALSTKIVKGDCIPTAGGGTAVLFNDIESHSHGTPYRAYN